MVVQATKVTLSLKFRRGDCAEDGAVAVSWVKRGSGVGRVMVCMRILKVMAVGLVLVENERSW